MERGHKITVLTGLPNYPEGQFFMGYGFLRHLSQKYNGATILRVPILPRGNSTGFKLALNYISFVISACMIGPLRCQDNYDLIFIYEPSPITVAIPALLIKWLKKIPVMFWVQDLWPESLTATKAISSSAILGLVGKLVKLIYNSCDQILMTSRAFLPSIVNYVCDKGQIHYFPQYGEDVYRVIKLSNDAPERLKMPSGFVVMFAGNIGAAQDFKTIISTALQLQKYKDIHFVILGDGRMRRWVEDEIAALKLGETFHLLGRYPLESMPSYFSLADVMLVTLKKDPIYSLTIPAKIQSYLACGKPVIAALEGEGAKIIEEADAGITCPAEDSEALANAILKMRNTPDEERFRMGKNGLEYYRGNFDRKVLIDRLEVWMKKLAGEKGIL
jgi:colanic acid biosynthesis glycosyl transferase WcaI